ncbi:MAG: proline dehydrogenase [Chloroflexota bacterium]|jgi:proline dehydrogenase|nr:proline dehydrogenase [Chloroflexota bacterium]
MPSVRAELLTTADCPHADAAEAVLRAALAAEDAGTDGHVSRVTISNLDEAGSYGFHGSPTIRIDGRDVRPPTDQEPIGLACRLYLDESGKIGGVPSAALVRSAIRERVAERRTHRGPVQELREIPGRVLRALFVWASQRPLLERLVRRLPLTGALVRRFVAGESLPDVLPALKRLSASGMHMTVDVLGESVASADDATEAANHYLETVEALARERLDVNVSLKLTAMGLDVDPELCRANVERIAARVAELDGFVRIDMEDHARTDVTLDIARRLFRTYGNVGVVIQSYLRRSAADIASLSSEGMRVRLCKGAYNEPASVAFASKAEVDESYARLMEQLLRAGTYPGLATHDEALIVRAVEFCRREGIGPERFEFQMLYGVRRDLQERLVRAGWTVRVYVPFGSEWYPYFMRRLAERPANLLFVLRNLVREGRG